MGFTLLETLLLDSWTAGTDDTSTDIMEKSHAHKGWVYFNFGAGNPQMFHVEIVSVPFPVSLFLQEVDIISTILVDG